MPEENKQAESADVQAINAEYQKIMANLEAMVDKKVRAENELETPDPSREAEDEEMDEVRRTEEDSPEKDEEGAEKALFERIWARVQSALGSKQTDDGTGFKVVGNHWLAVWSNDFKDREGEIFTRKAIDDYVRRVDMGLVPLPELWDSHIPGTKSGAAQWVARHGHFLLAGGTFDDTPKGRAAKAYYSKHAKHQGISHGYRFPTNQHDGKHYHAFNTFEISPLQRGAEANRFTSIEGIKEMTLTEQKKKRLYDVFGKEQGDQILADLDEKGKALEALNVEFKEMTDTDLSDGTKAEADALTLALKELLPDLIGGDAEAVKAAGEAVKQVKAMEKRLAKLEKAYSERPKRASKAEETELDEEDEDDKAIIDQIERERTDEKAEKAFPGLYNHNVDIRKLVPQSTLR